MLKALKVSSSVHNSFELKNVAVDLLPASTTTKVEVALVDLEAMRDGKAIPASKHGLETICGASCETGAV